MTRHRVRKWWRADLEELCGDALICTACGGLRNLTPHPVEILGIHWDRCRCQPLHMHFPPFESDSKLSCTMCITCGMVPVKGHSKYRRLLCDYCWPRVTNINEAAGRCVIPRGVHTFVNGIAVRVGPEAHTALQLQAGLDQIVANLREAGSMSDQGDQRVVRRCEQLGLTDPLVPLCDYRTTCQHAGITIESAWADFAIAAGLPVDPPPVPRKPWS